MVAKRMLTRMLAAALVALALVPMMATAAYADDPDFWVGDLGYEINEDGATVTVSKAADGVSGAVTIPGSVESGGKSYTVTAVGSEAFQLCKSLQSVGIPASVTGIGEFAFEGCTSLSEVTFEEGIQLVTIGGAAFGHCGSLGSIAIPASVREIGQYAFSGAGLTDVTLPEGLETINGSLFSGCGSLTQVAIPSTVTSIGNFAFKGCAPSLAVDFGGSRLQWDAIGWEIGNPDIVPGSYGKYDVTFDSRGGGEVAPQVIAPGGKATAPQAPTKDGMVFDGWYSDEDPASPFDFSNTAIDADLALHAGWFVRMAIGVYNRSNPGGPRCGTVDIEASALEYSHPAAPTMNYTEPEGENLKFTANPAEGYVFKGWYEGAVGASSYVEGPAGDPISENPELTAAAEDAACICAVFECAGHQWGEQKVRKATPTSDGRVYQVCSACGAEETIAPLPKVGTIKLAKTSFTYTGKAIQPKVTVANASEALSADCYTVSYSGNVNAGTATAKVTLKGAYHEGSKTLRFTIAKAANPLSAKAKTKKAVAVKAGKALAAKKLFKVSKAKGKVAYKKAKGSKKISVAKDGKVKVQKGCKKGTYALTVKVRAAGNANHKASAWKAVKVKVLVK